MLLPHEVISCYCKSNSSPRGSFAAVAQFADDWGISLRFRAAYAPSGNGIVERNHRTIKRIAARGKISPEEATFWYNVTPRKDAEPGSVPSNALFRYQWRIPFDINLREVDDCQDSSFTVCDEVWIKPPQPSCTRQWASGKITRVVSTHVVCVDGMPRHVRDVRKRRFGVVRDAVPVERVNRADVVPEPLVSGGGYFDVPFVSPQGARIEVATDTEDPIAPEADLPLPDVPEVDVPEVDGGDAIGGGEQHAELEVLAADPEPVRRSARERRRPAWMGDYVSN